MKLIQAIEFAFELKARESRRNSIVTYSSFVSIFTNYLKETKKANYKLEDFTKKEAIQYLDYVLVKRNVSALTRNNYLKAMKVLFYVLIDRDYIKTNPFSGIKKLKIERKRRTVFSRSECGIICNYLKGRDNGLLLAISLCYYCALRPSEIRRLKVQDIDLTNGFITLDGTETKNKNLARITMPNHLVEFCKEIGIKKYPANFHIMGYQLRPALEPCGFNTIRRTHLKVLRELEEYRLLTDIENKSFYSWKDTAARDMIEEGVNAAALMKHFRHASLETTQKYLESFGVKNDRIRELRSKIF
ncbi:site-specific integrase [Aureispira sp. CCB-E]|uniref:tyrosine-type recombinase/integrase n=1 Tax=Aureispira sp. CCB-E TaxID=3051121 RepID=UPI00286886B7|nr:site-specific integrase [Aureispira sp. CCB-E]WMX15266.1 site-specific integrase [Aureispira sp. CCB-E]